MADLDAVKDELAHLRIALEGAKSMVDPFFDDAVVLTAGRVAEVNLALERLREAEAAYADALTRAGFQPPSRPSGEVES